MRAPDKPSAGLGPDAIEEVRPKVRAMLTQIPSFALMAPEEQCQLANNMVRLLAYMSDPGGVTSSAGLPLAQAQATKDPVEQTKQNLSRSPGFAGKDFVAGAAQQGTDQFVRLVNNVDFASFVGGLVNNVFRVMVETSIEQMRAYAELVANVAKSAEDYMNENIGLGAGRDYLANRFPDLLDVDAGSDGVSRLTFKGEDEQAGLAEVHNTLGLPGEPPTDLSDEATELALVNAARLQMAKSRQQMLASMVMLGINRIVVTDGSINAKVKFKMRADDQAKRQYKASMYDSQYARNTNVSFFGGSFLGFGGGSVNVNEQGHVATVSTALDESSESKLELEAQLTGDVRVNFKSDFLPLEKMATPAMISAIQGNSAPVEPRRMATAAPGAAAATAPVASTAPASAGGRQ